MAVRLPIKVKAAAAMSVPLALLLVVAVLEVGQADRQARLIREQTDLATATIGPSGVITALQNERNFTGMWLLGAPTVIRLPVDDMDEARNQTDAAIFAFEDEVARKGGETERAYAPAVAAIEGEGGLRDVRAQVDAYDGPKEIVQYNPTADASFKAYSELIDALADPTTELSRAIEDGDLRRGVVLTDLASREVDRIAEAVRESLLLEVQGDGKADDPQEMRRASLMQDETERGHDAIMDVASGPYEELGEKLDSETQATGVRQIFRDLVATGEVNVPALLEAVSIQDDESYYGFIHDVSGLIRERADVLNAEAAASQRLVLLIAAFLLLASALAVPLVSRSISRPLLLLAREARDLATRRLPAAVRRVHDTPPGADVEPPELEPIEVKTRDEVADVADMLNKVQETAVALAVEQATLRRNGGDAFVSLARRNQNLLSRQIDYITELEAHESDARSLANLFSLDHQATRMRRNAESLLVLGGATSMRHSARPAPLTDVVRAALGEVDDFHAVRVTGLAPAVIDGTPVADLSHLLAELIDNAARVSPPGMPVEVRGHGGTGGYTLGIVDRGPGMSPEEMAKANRRLANEEAVTVAPSQYLGHYVAGILAARHGIAVTLQPTRPGGVTAVVRIPARLLVFEEPPAGLPTPRHAGGIAPGPGGHGGPAAGGPDGPTTGDGPVSAELVSVPAPRYP
jgi:signal transduction histidine kinase